MNNVDSKSFGETNDCTVRTLSIVSGMTYNEAHEVAQRAGRLHRRGMVSRKLLDFVETTTPLKFEKVEFSDFGITRMSVSRFKKLFPNGRFYVRAKINGGGHAFAIVDGVQKNALHYQTDRTMIQTAWKVVA